MPLFHVQDDDRPMWVLASDFDTATQKWRKFIAGENNNQRIEEVQGPTGVQKICDDDEFILGE